MRPASWHKGSRPQGKTAKAMLRGNHFQAYRDTSRHALADLLVGMGWGVRDAESFVEDFSGIMRGWMRGVEEVIGYERVRMCLGGGLYVEGSREGREGITEWRVRSELGPARHFTHPPYFGTKSETRRRQGQPMLESGEGGGDAEAGGEGEDGRREAE